MEKKRKKYTFIATILTLALALAPTVRAVEVVISGNGSESESQVEIQVETTTEVTQTNEANISNEVNTDTNTGDNSATQNTGGDTSINTGDIETEVSVENSVNSSVVEVACCPQETDLSITDNGTDSENSISLKENSATNISVEQSAKVANKIEGSANTGENTASNNNGNVSIQTGDIHVSGGIENGPINLADITAPSDGVSLGAKISANGSQSTNSISAFFNNDTNIFTNYQADIENFVEWDLNTGRNSAEGNRGDVSILTGDIFFDFFIKNGPINIGGIDIPCCLPYDPGDDGDGGEPDEPGDGEEPGDGQDDGGGDGDGGGGGGGGDGGVGGGPQVIGLSDTNSKAAKTLFFWAGILMILGGMYLIGKETSVKIAPSNEK